MNSGDMNGKEAAGAGEDVSKELGESRAAGLNALRTFHLLSRTMLAGEGRRLRDKYGTTHDRVHWAERTTRASSALAVELEAETELTSVKPPAAERDGFVLYGRVVDPAGRGFVGLTVQLKDGEHRPLRGIASCVTAAAGYFSFTFTKEDLEEFGRSRLKKVTLAVVSPRGITVYRHDERIAVKSGDVEMVEIALDRRRYRPLRSGAAAPEDEAEGTGKGTVSPPEGSETGPAETPTKGPAKDHPGGWTVKGAVAGKKGARKDMLVKLYDENIGEDQVLGSAVTDDQGRFSIVDREGNFARRSAGRPNLHVKIVDQAGRTVYRSRKAVRYEAGKVEVVRIRVRK